MELTMLTRATRFLVFLMWSQSAQIATGALLTGLLGVIAGTGTAVLIKRRRNTQVLTRKSVPSAVILLIFCLLDWALLWSLPRLQLSYATEFRPPLFASIVVRLFLYGGLVFAKLLAHWRALTKKARIRTVTLTFVTLNLAFSAVQVDAYVVEPTLVDTTQRSLAFDDLDPALPPIRVVHLTDTHIERNSYREAMVTKKVNALQPDIIVLTGDYLNLSRLRDPTSAAHFREFVGQLEASHGIYAVRGSVEPSLESMTWLVEDTDVVWLEQESVTVDVRGQQVTLVGVACSHRIKRDAARLRQALSGIDDSAFTLLLYHSPDLIREAAGQQIDLYLGGHTHGGQLRLPFYGAIFTASKYGKRYEAGLYREGHTQMYISRGIGFEGGGMPRARFLCRPEIISLELRGTP
jgi:predicted MPP superfamily phosphohydrolase